MKTTKLRSRIGLCLLIGIWPALAATHGLAQGGDSSADAQNRYTNTVADSGGVVLRVPIDQQGRELASSAEMRVVGHLDDSTNLPEAFRTGTDAATAPTLNATDSSTDASRDSSTWGWYGYRGNGWYPNYYYNSYYPRYYSYGNYYNYGYPYYNNYYYNSYRPYWNYYGLGNYYGYRYYGYRRWY
jgi:hypothetical protein